MRLLADLACKPIINWVGGKEKLMNPICLVFPPNIIRYAEHFGGSAAILLGRSKKRGVLEVLNDYDNNLTNLYVCVKKRVTALIDELGYMPLQSEAEFQVYKRCLERGEPVPDFTQDELVRVERYFTGEQARELDGILEGRADLYDVRRAVAFYMVNHASFSGTMKSFGIKLPALSRTVNDLMLASKRLERVVILNRDFGDSIKVNDKEGTLHYCDPPYYGTEDKYRVLFPPSNHERLHEIARQCKGRIVISYVDCDYIRDLYQDFFILAFERPNTMAHEEGAKFGEVIITNFDPRPIIELNAPQLSMFHDLPEGLELVNIPKTERKLLQ